MSTELNLQNQQEEPKKEEQKKEVSKKKKVLLFLLIAVIIILLVVIAVEIAIISDFYIYKGKGDGLIWTVAQRQFGFFARFWG
ncbi:hypothetical protein [Mycoplasma sp. Ms02]|uniref:hypothetical protein n=1 Tax=Mycoplasma sp. Ms02 TaxID=353851 RepID=UPI001C88F1C1|nr:hypothetical protein [Mycoplasma sp. Ms02]QZE12628.1 hypothetical protein K4L35_01425 [Mycoplasma sp. Ms02]